MTAALYRVGKAVIAHRRLVLIAWILLLAGAVIAVKAIGANTSNNLNIPGTDSTQAQDLLTDNLPEQANGTNPLVLEAPSGRLDDQANSKVVAETVKSVSQAPHVTSAVSPLSPQGAAALSKDGKIGYISVTLDVGASDLDQDEADAVIDAAGPATDAGFKVAAGGYLGNQVSKPSTESSEAVGLIAAVIILLITFGTVVAMGMPILNAVFGLATSLSLIGLLGHLFEVPQVGPTLATMIGLGVGIDYSLFIITRYRARALEGMERHEALARSVATAGSAVAFAGGTVMIALLSLALTNIPLVSALGYSAAVAVLVAVLAATTLLPAVLAMLGPRIESLRVPLPKRAAHDAEPHGWRRWANGVAERPWPAIALAVALLLALAIPVLNLQLGQQDNGQLPTSTQSRQSYDLLSEGFGPGVNGPLLVAVQLGSPAKSGPDDPRLTGLESAIAKTAGVESVTPAQLDKAQTTAVFTVIPDTAPSADSTEKLVRKLRDTVIPDETKGEDVQAYVGGQTAGYIDLADRIGDKLPSVIGIVVALSILVLMLAFRSVLVPLTSGLMNLLSVAAAYGIVTFVFQEGHGAGLIGLEGATPIVSYVPLLMFAILFGLSMDYQVFLVGRVSECYQQDPDNRRAVVEGLATSGRVITSAALIMVSVFLSFVLNGDPVVKQFGVGMAAAIAVDATIVRCLLVPAVMEVLGKANWWLPDWLDRLLPHIGLEEEMLVEAEGEAPAPARG